MSQNLESNKIFAAVLVAGIIAMFGGFLAREIIHPEFPETDAVTIEGAAAEGGGAQTGPTGPQPILAMIATADVAKGEKLSKACAACHSFNKGEPFKVGPNLWGVVGGPKAHEGDFAYSDGLKNKGGAWTYEDLNHFLYKPKGFIPDTKMGFIGFKKAEERAEIIAWLRTMADSPKALPSAGDIAAEEKELGGAAASPAAAPGTGSGQEPPKTESGSAPTKLAPDAPPKHETSSKTPAESTTDTPHERGENH